MRRGHREITVNKVELLKILKENLENHIADYETACKGFRVEATERLEKALDSAKSGGKIITDLDLEEPVSHASDYETVIGMLELSVSEQVVIDQDEYLTYVKDEWGWKPSFDRMSTVYNSKWEQTVGSARWTEKSTTS